MTDVFTVTLEEIRVGKFTVLAESALEAKSRVNALVDMLRDEFREKAAPIENVRIREATEQEKDALPLGELVTISPQDDPKVVRATRELLADYEIDAAQVALGGWDEEGYRLTEKAGGGYREWPPSFPVEELIKIRGGVGK